MVFGIDSINFIPQALQQKAVDATVGFVVNVVSDDLTDEMINKIEKLRFDRTFHLVFKEAFNRAANRFFDEYIEQDEDLVEAIANDQLFFENEEVQQALLTLLQNPMVEEQVAVMPSFDRVLPHRRNRKRVNQAVMFFLRRLVKEVWNLPQLRPALVVCDNTTRYDPPQVSHNLPDPDYQRFVGRKAELKQIRLLLSPNHRSWAITIDGIGGIGKSTLALEVAHDHNRNLDQLPPEERFDAIIWITAKQSILTSEGIMPRPHSRRILDDIYNTIAIALEREEITRARTEEQDDIVRRVLTQQRILLIIDNLETVDDERVMTFIREAPIPTKVIVTTRHRLDVAYPIRLTGISEDEALQLITDEANKKGVSLTDQEARRLFTRTGGVPLAIVWSIAQIGFDHNLEAVLTRLGQPTSDIAKFCFEGAIKLIRGEPAHKLLMALSLFATDASREALGYVANLPILDRDEGLGELEKLSLVNKTKNRFSLLPLTKVYSKAELAKEVELEEKFRQRWVQFFVDFLLEQGKKYESLELVRHEIENVLSVMDWSWQKNNLKKFIDILEQINFYLWATGHWSSWSRYLKLGSESASLLDAELSQANLLNWLSSLKYYQDDLSEAQNIIEKAIKIYQSLNKKSELALSIRRLSSIQIKCGEYSKARKNLEKSLKLVKEVNDERYISRIQRQLARLDIIEGKYDLAEKRLHQARELREHQTKLSSGLAYTYRLLGQVSFKKQFYNYASQYFQISLEIGQKISSQHDIAEAKQGMAELEWTIGHSQKAKLLAYEAIEVFTRLGMKREARETQAFLEKITN